MKFPNLSKIKDIALDIETTDPDLKKLGPGARRPGSKILGVALSTKDKDFYFKADNKLYDYLADLKNKNFITARGLYDFDFLQYKGVNVSAQNSRIIDVQINAALLDDNRFKYNLDTLAKEALGVGKDERGLIKFCEDNELKGPPQTHLEKMPFELVSRYAKIDARRTFDLYTWQKPQIESQKLLDVFNLECDLLPLLLDMLRTGIRFDEKRRAELEAIYNERIEKAQKAIDKIAGRPVNVESNKQLQAVYDDLGFAYSFTEKGNPCFNAEALEGNPSILSEKVIHLRQVLKIQNTYIIGAKRFIINGRIHPLFHPLKNDNNGTVTGRFSSSLPNLQNQPSKNEVFKKEIRALYLPDKGQDFLRLDYSQIELRCLAHYAIGEGADEIRAIYTQKPDLDIHQACADMIEEERKIAKSINFGVVYGMGTDKLGRSLKIIRAKQPTKKEMTAYYKRGVTAGNETYFEQY